MKEKMLSPDAQYVKDFLMPELEDKFRGWSQEYQQERDLGVLGEFVGLYRKARKLKTVFIDRVDPSTWRESVRTILFEVAAHALLAIRDIDVAERLILRCSSNTRPASPLLKDAIYELDTGLVRVWTGSRWISSPEHPGAGEARAAECGEACRQKHNCDEFGEEDGDDS